MKVLVKSPYSIYSGYGQDGFGMIRALHKWGCDVYPQPVWLDVPIPPDLMPLFGKTLEGPFDLTINHWSPDMLGMRPEAREMTRCAVAWTMWEFCNAPGPVVMKRRDGTEYTAKPKSGLVPHCGHRDTLRKRLELFDLVLGYDDVTMGALSHYIPATRGKGGPPVAQAVLQGGYESGEWNQSQRDWFSEDFMFCMHGALNNRKCAWTAVQAFTALKHEHKEEFAGAKLGLHSLVPGLFPEMNEVFKDQRLKVFMEPWDHDTLQQFYDSSHCLLAPSRGEGKNLPALEFMTTGGVVAATDFGGHRNWLRDDYAYPLSYELRPTYPARPDAAHDARVSVEHLKDTMWHIFTHRAEARQKGELAAKTIPAMCDWSVVVESLFRSIRDNCPHNGQLIYDLAMSCRQDSRENLLARSQPFLR